MSRLVKAKAKLGYLYGLLECILVLFCVCRKPSMCFNHHREKRNKNTNMNLVINRTNIHV